MTLKKIKIERCKFEAADDCQQEIGSLNMERKRKSERKLRELLSD